MMKHLNIWVVRIGNSKTKINPYMEDNLDKIIKKVLREQSVIGAPNQGMAYKEPSEEEKKIQQQ